MLSPDSSCFAASIHDLYTFGLTSNDARSTAIRQLDAVFVQRRLVSEELFEQVLMQCGCFVSKVFVPEPCTTVPNRLCRLHEHGERVALNQDTRILPARRADD